MIKQVIVDWGGTIMIDYALEGPMYLWEKVDWVPGAQFALRELAAQYPLCIATNAPHSGTEEMIKALDRVGARRFFSTFFSSKELGYGKPDPRFFLAIAGKLGMAPEECLMVGNHYTNDIIGAKEAGMLTIYYNEKQLNGPFDKADRVIDDMGDLAGAIRSIAGKERR
ncbi:MAG: HAD family hydrolase [Bacteroidales bacterium]|nr:HAD family hydrolase [Bacteroidales bacterium]